MTLKSSLPARLSRGECILGATLLIPSPHLVEMVGHAGFDCLMIDQEHAPASIETVEGLVRAADAVRLPALVRVPRNAPEAIMGVLDLGACGVVVPHVETEEAALAAVRATRFPPEGIRGLCPSVRGAEYGGTTWATYSANVLDQTAVIPIIEDREGVRSIDRILAVEGLTAVLIGTVDLAASLGVPGQVTHETVCHAAETVLESARTRGIPVGMVVYDGRELKTVDTWLKNGVRLFLLSLTGSIVRMLREVRSLISP
ncbi:MAG: hypothetical protein A3G80_15270 [Betaproteobacteria bacterium RIFCSPLOWO2_12_FULL_62_13b]|nr:MAG: hypothetical protein A3G80_15270 [Betaproteobacteria bacterium RIFCSPLOWO2_12_FULL_62_13b]